jgi:hypothetical protein
MKVEEAVAEPDKVLEGAADDTELREEHNLKVNFIILLIIV